MNGLQKILASEENATTMLCIKSSCDFIRNNFLTKTSNTEPSASLSSHNPLCLLLSVLCRSQETGLISLFWECCVKGSKALTLIDGRV